MKRTLLLLMALVMSAGFAFADNVVSLGLPTSDGAGNGNAQQGILVSGIMDKIAAAKYLVLETNGVGDNAGGFGGIHFIFQGNDGGSLNIDWTDVGINGGWLGYPRADGKTVSIAVDIKAALGANYDKFIQCTGWARFIIAYYGGATATAGLALQDVFLTADFAKPAGAVDLTGTTGFIFDGSVKDIFGTGIIQAKPMISNVCNTDGGIIVNGNKENVNIYTIDGRLVKQAVAAQGSNIPLQKGLYVVKVGTDNAVKVVVK